MQFRLKTVLLLQLAIAALLACLADEIRARRRQAAVANELHQKLQRLPDVVGDISLAPSGPTAVSNSPVARFVFGESYFVRPKSALVFFYGSYDGADQDATAIITKIGDLPSLDSLRIHLPRIREINLHSLRTLGQLTYLDLEQTRIGPRGLDFMRSMPALEYLGLEKTGLTDADAHLIGKCERLVRLNVSETQIGDPTLEEIGKLKHLQSLFISGTKVSGDGLKHLRGLKKLEYIDMSRIAVDETGARHLAAIGSLQTLVLSDICIQETDVEALQKALPNCWILRER
ncbi:MAG TPA: hypothetical protein VJ783_17270 [Pirellulales bacterium]|nr:hypothetical protein [Pirellulales bacterium]